MLPAVGVFMTNLVALATLSCEPDSAPTLVSSAWLVVGLFFLLFLAVVSTVAILAATPEKYMSCIKKVTDANGVNITVDELEKEILEWYDLRNSTLNDGDDEDETAMTGFTFNGKCYNCGHVGYQIVF